MPRSRCSVLDQQLTLVFAASDVEAFGVDGHLAATLISIPHGQAENMSPRVLVQNDILP